MARNNALTVSMDQEVQKFLKDKAKKKKISASKLINDLIEKYVFDTNETIPVILKIPLQLKNDRAELENWLQIRCSAIVNKLIK